MNKREAELQRCLEKTLGYLEYIAELIDDGSRASAIIECKRTMQGIQSTLKGGK